jgi:hypothetical protein
MVAVPLRGMSLSSVLRVVLTGDDHGGATVWVFEVWRGIFSGFLGVHRLPGGDHFCATAVGGEGRGSDLFY